MFQIAHQFDGAVAGTNHAQMQRDVPVLGADGLEGGNLHAAGQNRFKILHGQRPGEGLLVEELVEGIGLREQLGIVGPLHQGLVALPLLGDAGDLGVEGVFAGARLLRPSGAGRAGRGRERSPARARMPMPMRSRLRAGPRSAKGRVARLSVMRIG